MFGEPPESPNWVAGKFDRQIMLPAVLLVANSFPSGSLVRFPTQVVFPAIWVRNVPNQQVRTPATV